MPDIGWSLGSEKAMLVETLRAENERLRDAKRRALAIADERAKEAVVLRAALEAINGEIVLTGQLKDIVDAALEQSAPDERGHLQTPTGTIG